MSDIATILTEPETTVAVVGATDNSMKYGSVIYRDLKRKGYAIFPVNPNRAEVDGDPAYPSLDKLPEKPTIVNIVVPPEVTLRILQQCLEHGLDNIWLQRERRVRRASPFFKNTGSTTWRTRAS